MENSSNNSEFLKNAEAKIQQKVSIAKENALTEREYEDVSEAEYEMQSIQNMRELTDKEVFHYHQFRDKMNKASIEVETLTEARRVMGILGFDPHSIIDTLSHENAHGNKAEELGAKHLGYKFVLIKSANGGFLVQPQAMTYIPDEWDKEKQNDTEMKILQAPEEYGNEMSQSDKNYLEDLK